MEPELLAALQMTQGYALANHLILRELAYIVLLREPNREVLTKEMFDKVMVKMDAYTPSMDKTESAAHQREAISLFFSQLNDRLEKTHRPPTSS